MQCIGHVNDIVQHNGIGNQILILDALFVLDWITRFDEAFTTKEDPLRKKIVGFYFGCRRLDLRSEGSI
jgi:hypothetical protein